MIIKRDFVYTPKNQPRTLHIYLPDDYAVSTERYPVMYFFDGHNLFSNTDATYGKSWGLREFLDKWDKKIIIVGIECTHEGRERLNEYSPYTFGSRYIGRVVGTGTATMDWIVNEIKPMIDREYRTYSFREATGIGGSSMGGLMSVFAGVKYNSTFSKCACLSSTIGPCFKDVMMEILNAKLDPDTKFYLSWGTEEAGGTKATVEEDWQSQTARNNLAAEALIRQQSAQTYLDCQRWGGHCEADWEKLVPTFMEYLWM